AAMRFHIGCFAGFLEHIAKVAAHGMSKRDVRRDSFANKSRFASAGSRAIKELLGNHHVERRILFLQRTNRRRRPNSLDAEQLHPVDVRAERNFCWCESM